MNIVVEYLVITSSTGNFCSTKSAFNQLLQVDSRLSLISNKLTYQDSKTSSAFTCLYDIVNGEVKGKPQRFFQLKFTAEVEEAKADDDLAQLSNLLRAVRGVVAKAHESMGNLSPEVLWDDISSYYSQKAYPLLQRTENMMRKLIANFMLTTVGKDWVTETSPKEFADALKNSKRQDFNNQLHKVDFSDLADFLLKSYSGLQSEHLFSQVRKMKIGESLPYETLQDYVPLSNWQRYFATLVDCEDQYLKVRWEELYKLRCKVAHNAQFEKRDFDRVCELIIEINPKVNDAISKIAEVVVPQDEKDSVAEDAVARLYPATGEFMHMCRELEARIMDYAVRTLPDMDKQRYRPFLTLLSDLHHNGKLPITFLESVRQVRIARNILLHDAEVTIDEDTLSQMIKDVNLRLKELEHISSLDEF